MKIRNIHVKLFYLLALALPFIGYLQASAFDLSTYATQSVLSEGRWVRVSIPETGIYMVTNADLRKYGFSDPSKVRVYGYGAQRMSDVLSLQNYTDDLPMVQSATTSDGIVFYGLGPETWVKVGSNYKHTRNPFSSYGYYFLSDREVVATDIPRSGVAEESSQAVTTFKDRLFHESELVSPGHTGHLIVGEDFLYKPTQSFSFSLVDKEGEDAWLQCCMVAKSASAPLNVSFTANGKKLPGLPSDCVAGTTGDVYGTSGIINKSFEVEGTSLKLGVTVSTSGALSLANLDYIDINYTRKIKLNGGKLLFRTSATGVKLEGASSKTHVWDVTSPRDIREMNVKLSGTYAAWSKTLDDEREYAAWDEGASLPSPEYVETVSNQNLHGTENVDMVIVTLPAWKSQAERVAELHRNSADSLRVLVATQQEVFNEFSSGASDVNAFRRLFKMLWDRGNAGGGRQLKYALLMGRGSYDNRRVTSTIQALGYPLMPIWQSDVSFSDNTSYTMDDIMAFLRDNSGKNVKSDYYCISIGRMPVRSLAEATRVVDKLYQYVGAEPYSGWKNKVVLFGDVGDNNAFFNDCEESWRLMVGTPDGGQFVYNKVYVDAYSISGVGSSTKYPDAISRLYRLLDEGSAWWVFSGHSNENAIGSESFIKRTDIDDKLSYKQVPMLCAVTCDIMQWDNDAQTCAEVMYMKGDGGIIGCFSATRPVYITQNSILVRRIAPYITTRGVDGRYLPIGEVFRRGKNDCTNDDNKLRYVLMGDPAMRVVVPENKVVLQSINGAAVDPDAQVTIMARQNVELKGIVTDCNGNKLSNFNGRLEVSMYDAVKSYTTFASVEHSTEAAFDQQGDILYSGTDSVRQGEFTLKVAMPTNISGNFRPAALSMYAHADDNREAVGCNRDFYVYGYDETAPEDTEAPQIETMVLNHSSFVDGMSVNESPMLIARISDNVGINLSSAGVGQQMSLQLDGGGNTYNDVTLYYTSSSDGSPSGEICYPLENLQDGSHTLRLRVWDTSGNMAEKTISFFVQTGLAPVIYDVYSDANPATTATNFYITHNRPDARMTVTVTVYNLLGSPVWSASQSGRSDMFSSFPIKWNLCDNAGRRVSRGIYVYRASISTDGEHFETASRKIAVAGQ